MDAEREATALFKGAESALELLDASYVRYWVMRRPQLPDPLEDAVIRLGWGYGDPPGGGTCMLRPTEHGMELINGLRAAQGKRTAEWARAHRQAQLRRHFRETS